MSIFTSVEIGLKNFRQKLDQNHPQFINFLNFEAQLLENIRAVTEYGDEPTRSSRRSQLIKSLNSLALDTINVPFNDLCDQTEEAIFPKVSLEDLPPLSKIFIGRREELAVFGQTVSDLIFRSQNKGKQIFLLRGEGGIGKSTLLGQFVQICQRYEEGIRWIYIDWESSGVDSTGGTVEMMHRFVDLFRQRYGAEFSHFELVAHKQIQVMKRAREIRHESNSLPQVDLEMLLKESLSRADFQLYKNPQTNLSKAFVLDLRQLAEQKPIVLFLDTYEVVLNFADEWVRNGLIQFCLRDPNVGQKFLVVIAGRISEEIEVMYRDDIERRFSLEGALYRKIVDRFTPGEIQEYLEQVLDAEIDEELAGKLYQITHGIPLAVHVASFILKERIDADFDFLFDGIQAEVEKQVIAELTQRFLRHCIRQSPELREIQLNQIYSFALLRESGSEDSVRRTNLLASIWLRTGLVQKRNEFWPSVQKLRRRYSFLFSGGSMHVDVRSYLRQALSQGIEERGQMIRICEEARRICILHLKKCERHLEKYEEQERVVEARYKNIAWQQWLLDLIAYEIWLQNHDNAMYLLIDHYFMAIQYGSNKFHLKLLTSVKDDPVFFNALPVHQKELVRQLGSLKEWLGNKAMEEVENKFKRFLKGRTKIEAILMGAKAAIDKGRFEKAYADLVQAERMYLEMSQKLPEIEKNLAKNYHALGTNWANSSNHKTARIKGLKALYNAVEWAEPNDARLKCSIANVLVKLWRLREAQDEYKLALSDMPQVAKKGLERIKQLEHTNRYSYTRRKKEARILTSMSTALSSFGRFEEAKKKIEAALGANPSFVPAQVKLSHILRSQGKFEDARAILNRINVDSVTYAPWKTVVLDALGAINMSLEKWNEARSAYMEAVEISPDYINALNGLGRVYLYERSPSVAIGYFEKAIKVKHRSQNPIRASLFWVYNGLGMASLRANYPNQDSFFIAESLCRRYLENESRQYHTWSNLGIALLGQQKNLEALEAFKEFAQITKARGLVLQILRDIEFFNTHDRTEGSQQAFSYLTTLL